MIIALIEDDPICRFVTEKLIEKVSKDHEILQFKHGLDALDFLKACGPEQLPELIFLDINMPVMDGWDFLEAFRNLNIAICKPDIYILSSSNDTADLNRAKLFPELAGYLIKPLLRQQLIAILINH